MLKYIRIALAWIFILAIMWLFLDFTGIARAWFGWMAKIQLVPAVLALNLLAIAIIVGLTLLVGRIYCSVICPLGVMQDGFNWLRGLFGKKSRRKNRFKYTSPNTRTRLTILVVFIALLMAGGIWAFAAKVIAPYSAFGRIVGSIVAPVYDWGNNLLAARSEAAETYTFYRVNGANAWSMIVAGVAVATFVILAVWSFIRGREYCNTVCPVGTVLGLLSRWSVFGIVIDTDKCINCGKCGKRCKASCIDTKNHWVDNTRCVDCMDCIGYCSTGAISFTRRPSHVKVSSMEVKPDKGGGSVKDVRKVQPTEESRRQFLVTGAIIAGTAAVATAQHVTDGGLAKLDVKTDPNRKVKITPPGSKSWDNFANHCTACQLCINQCPNLVLSPSTELDTLMMPTMSYLNGYCRPECNVCSTVCPTGSIVSLLPEERPMVSVGLAEVDYDHCLAASVGTSCGNCARHCPVDAITMVAIDPAHPHGRQRPIVNPAKCIGCGACEHLCPVAPISAITVNGRAQHAEL